MKKDALLVNKIAAAGIAAALFGMITAEIGKGLYPITEDVPVARQAFVIAEPSSADLASASAVEQPTGPGDILPMLASADIEAGIKVARKCGSCHSFDDGGAVGVGPNLYNIVNAEIGGSAFAYSQALAGKGGVWDYEALNGFLYKPVAWAPGTKMSFRGLKKDKDRANLIAYMRSLSGSPAPLP